MNEWVIFVAVVGDFALVKAYFVIFTSISFRPFTKTVISVLDVRSPGQSDKACGFKQRSFASRNVVEIFVGFELLLVNFIEFAWFVGNLQGLWISQTRHRTASLIGSVVVRVADRIEPSSSHQEGY